MAQLDGTAPLTTEDVLREEAAAIHGPDAETVSGKTGPALHHALNALGAAALCLSGGGIRSAAFALGVIQALAAHPRSATGAPSGRAENSLLAKFHYLSTVSGGGYIGSWLSASRTRNDFPSLWASLTGRPGGAYAEPRMIAWLRSYSNYLAPKLGVMSVDARTDIALLVRNLILNWLIIIPSVCTPLLALKIIAILSEWVTQISDWRIQLPFAAIGAVSQMAVLVFITRHRPSRRGANGQDGAGVDQTRYLRNALPWAILSAAFLAQFLASDFIGTSFLATWSDSSPCPANSSAGAIGGLCQSSGGNLVPSWPMSALLGLGALCGAAIYALSWLLAYPRKKDVRDFLFWIAAGCAYGVAVALGFFLYLQIPDKGISLTTSIQLSSVVLHIVFGVPWILLSQAFADMIFVGLSSYQRRADADREWLACTDSWILATALGWFLLTFLAFFGAVVASDDLDVWSIASAWLAPLGGISGIVTALLASSSITTGHETGRGAISRWVNIVLSIAAPIFGLALIVCLSVALDYLLLGEDLVPNRFSDWDNDSADRIATLLILALSFVCFTAITLATSWFININRFSLHARYRNRLIRAFLGASRDRRPDPLTDLDDQDNPPLRNLWPPANPARPGESGGWAPFHVVNTTLNVVSAKKRAVQQQKTASFAMTPLHCGYSSKFAPGSNHTVGAFRASADYGGGMTLGTAMAISGAATSRDRGYHSSPGITFLMTLFNVRLGWWLGNPAEEGRDTYALDGPRFAIVPLVQEMFGLTTNDKKYIYLSDGGHFENLGLYEMVRRRCRWILVSDAGCDPAFGFEDLGNAVRKIAIDLGVPIRLLKLEALKPRPEEGDVGPGHDYHAIGEIDYRTADGEAAENGIILYIKAGYHGVESAGIRSYAMANPEFPHQATLDRWFSEAQFESYRALGFEITDGILSKAMAQAAGVREASLETVFAALRTMADAAPVPTAAAKED